MKKLFVVLLAVLVLGSVALVAVACGTEEETATTAVAEETTVTEAGPAVLTVTEVKALGDGIVAEYKAAGEDKATIANYSAGEVTFAGPVLKVSEKPDKYIVGVGTAEASFSLSFMKDALAGLGLTAEALTGWIGQNVEVSGEVVLNPFGGGAEIKITDAAQVVLK